MFLSSAGQSRLNAPLRADKARCFFDGFLESVLTPRSCIVALSPHGIGTTTQRALLRRDGLLGRAQCQALYHKPCSSRYREDENKDEDKEGL